MPPKIPVPYGLYLTVAAGMGHLAYLYEKKRVHMGELQKSVYVEEAGGAKKSTEGRSASPAVPGDHPAEQHATMSPVVEIAPDIAEETLSTNVASNSGAVPGDHPAGNTQRATMSPVVEIAPDIAEETLSTNVASNSGAPGIDTRDKPLASSVPEEVRSDGGVQVSPDIQEAPGETLIPDAPRGTRDAEKALETDPVNMRVAPDIMEGE